MRKKPRKNKVPNIQKTVDIERHSSFLKKICCCFYSRSSQKQISKNNLDSYIRQEFQQQQTQNQQKTLEQTESNLPISNQVYVFQEQSGINTNSQIQKQLKNIEGSVVSGKGKQIKFNIKRRHIDEKGLNQATEKPKEQFGGHQDKHNNIVNSQVKNQINQASKAHRLGSLSKDTNIQKNCRNGSNNKIIQKINNIRFKQNRSQLINIEKQLQKMQDLTDYQFLHNCQQSFENYYPINQLDENKLIILGDKKNKLLSKITSVKIFPFPSSIDKYKESMKIKKFNQRYGRKQQNLNSELDKYWQKRYFLFQKFDQGIKLDDQSWQKVTPEAVADYISSKVNVKQTILDAFCGVGGDSIKLASSCKNVISNDIDEVKVKCLVNNAKVYDINNISVNCADFFKLSCKVDAVYLAPPWPGRSYHKMESLHPQSLEPKLSEIIEKAFTLSHNIFFLLPANTEIQPLISIICQKTRKSSNFYPHSCSLKLQKIYFNQRLKFIAGFYGNSQVQNDIKLAEELSYIYGMLKQDNDVIFKHKKLIRKVREQHGMVNLLNYVFQCQQYGGLKKPQSKGSYWDVQQIPLIQKLQNYLLQKNLIDVKLLKKIKQQQQLQHEYELRHRSQRNKIQKDRKTQKIKQKQLQQILVQNSWAKQNGFADQQRQGQYIIQQQNDLNQYNGDIPTQAIIKERDVQKEGVIGHGNRVLQSGLSSDNTIQSSQCAPIEDSMRTVSMISQFHEDQLKNMMQSRLRTNSDVSILDSIHPVQKFDQLQISIDQRVKKNQSHRNKLLFSVEKDKKQKLPDDAVFHRHSSPDFLSPQQNIKMKKHKPTGEKWARGTAQKVNQDNERDL